MTDFSLTLAADARRLRDGETGLDRLGDAAERAERRTQQSTGRMSKAWDAVAGLISGNALSIAESLGTLAASYLSLRTVETAITNALDFNRAITETSTLIEGTPAQLNAISGAARDMAMAFGQDATSEVKGFYEALSAGADSVAEAQDIVNVANQAAIGGATDTATAVDILTSALNVYSKEGLTAAEASDALFVGVVAGKTTMEELARSMGLVLPMAQVMGVSFDSVTAAVAALTAGGIKTSEAVTGVRASLVAVLNPSKDAQELAKKLGIDFNEAGLRAKGFGGFMSDIIAKTHGSATAIQTLFGSVEATTTALAFAGTAGTLYGSVMDQMAEKAGSTSNAFKKMIESMPGRMDVAWAKLRDVLLSLGAALLPVVVPAFELLANTLHTVVDVFGLLAPVAVPALQAIGFAISAVATVIGALGTGVKWLNEQILTPFATFLWDTLIVNLTATATAIGDFLAAIVPQPIQDLFDWLVKLGSEGLAYLKAIYDGAENLINKIGTTATVFDLMASVAAEALGKVGAAWDWLKATGAAAAMSLSASFLGAINKIIGDFIEMTWAIADGLNTLFNTDRFQGASATVTQELRRAQVEAEGLANSYAAAAATAKDAMTAPIKSLGALSMLLQDTSTSAVGAGTDLEGMGEKISGAAGKTDDLASSLDGAGKAGKKTKEVIDDMTKAMNGAFIKAIDGVSDAFADWVMHGFGNIKDVMKDIRQSFSDMIKSMISTAISNPIKVALGVTKDKDGNTVLKPDSILGKISSGFSAFTGALGTGFSGVVDGFLSGGFAGAGSALTGSLAGATSGLAGLGAAIGAIAAPLAAVALIFAAFKTKTTILDSGLQVTIKGMDALVQSFEVINKKSFFGLISKTRTSTTEMDAKEAAPIIEAVRQVQQGVIDAADALGIAGSTFDSFAYDLSVSTKGMSQDQAVQAIQAKFAEMGDAMAAMIDGLDAFSKPGEGAATTLHRLADAAAAVNGMIDTLGGTFKALTLETADMASQLVDAFGGLNAMNAAFSTYFQGFYTDAERMAVLTRQTSEAFAKLGIVMPTTRDGFRALIEAQDLTTEAGRENYAALMLLAGAMNQILPAISSFTTEISSLVTAASGNLADLITATGNALNSAKQAAASWYQVAGQVRAYMADLRGTAGPGTSAAQARAYNETRFQTTLAAALAGSQDAYGQLTGIADKLLEGTSATAHTAEEAAIAQARILADLTKAAGVADIYGGQQDVMASLLQQQVDLLTEVKDFLAAGGTLDPARIDALNTQLGDLQGAIEDVGQIDYASIVAKMDVTTTLIDKITDPALKALLMDADHKIEATIEFATNTDGLTPEERWIVMHNVSEGLRTIKASIDLGKLTADQRAFLDTLTDTTAGKLTLGGKFQWDPSTGFQVWFSRVTGTNVADPIRLLKTPMEALRGSLADLAKAVRAQIAFDLAQKKAQEQAAAIAAAQAKLATAFAARGTALTALNAAVAKTKAFDAAHSTNLVDNQNRAANIYVDENGKLQSNAAWLMGTSAADIAAFKAAFYGPDGLSAQMWAADKARAEADKALEKARQQVIDLGGTPAFAGGGFHRGGLRIVGENGPELEATGPARYYSATATAAMMRGKAGDEALLAEVRAMRREVEQLREQNRQIDTEILKNVRKSRILEEGWDASGLPPTRV